MNRRLVIDGGRLFSVDDSRIRYHLPNLGPGYDRHIDLYHLSHRISNISDGRLGPHEALGPLKSIFHAARKSTHHHLDHEVSVHLLRMAENRHNPSKIRKHFMTLAYLAQKGSSPTIAQQLLDFCNRFIDDIADDYRHLDDWEHAISKLGDLIPVQWTLDRLANRRHRFRRPYSPPYYPPYNLYSPYRGRSPTRTSPRHRARTLPPMFYPVPQIAAPNFLTIPASRGIMSGFPSPSVFAQDPLEAEIEDMREHQFHLEEAVAQLQLGQQELVDEVVQQGFGHAPLQLTY